MTEKKVYVTSNLVTPNKPITHDEDVCVGCNTCVNQCRTDVMMPNPVKGKPPIVVYPDECWYCGTCVKQCPLFPDKTAIRMTHSLWQRGVIGWKRKETGEHFRIGMRNAPPPVERPPSGGWDAKTKKATSQPDE